jgi:aspartyl-tRNA(Asn)/glutamyl-tRNA(Gln) amidotransferase subunit A
VAGPVYTPVATLSKQIRDGKVFPVELAETFLNRLETLGPRYNSVVNVTRKLALKQARKAEKEIEAGKYRGPLHGVPWGAKDLLSTKGIPTTWGAEPFCDRILATEATSMCPA